MYWHSHKSGFFPVTSAQNGRFHASEGGNLQDKHFLLSGNCPFHNAMQLHQISDVYQFNNAYLLPLHEVRVSILHEMYWMVGGVWCFHSMTHYEAFPPDRKRRRQEVEKGLLYEAVSKALYSCTALCKKRWTAMKCGDYMTNPKLCLLVWILNMSSIQASLSSWFPLQQIFQEYLWLVVRMTFLQAKLHWPC